MIAFLVALFMGVYQILFGTPLENKIDRFLSHQQFSGTVLVAQGDEIVHCKGYGFANLEHGIPNTPHTVFRIASISKQFTAFAIMQLQEQGLLSVHDPVIKFLPNFPHKTITLHHLLTHSSGLTEITDFPNLKEIQRIPSTPETVVGYFQEMPLQFTPGSECAYCNSGYVILGVVLEMVTGDSYAHYMQEHVFDPLGLQATYYDLYQSIIPNRASGYVLQPDGTCQHASFIDMTFPHAAGALASTVNDLFIWNRALISSEKFLSLSTVQAFDTAGTITYGYGLCIGSKNTCFKDVKSPIIGHTGSIEGFSSALAYYPESRVTVILLSNSEEADICTLHTTLASIFPTSFWR